MKLLHTMLRVKNIEKSLEFYEKLIGLKLVSQKRLDDCTLYFLSDGLGEVEIELTYNDETPDNGYDLGSGFGHLAFETESMDEFAQNLKSLNYSFLYEPYQLSAVGSTIAFIKDPDEYEIEIIQKNK